MVIGVTGGIGAGKSTVMEYMRQNYDVYTILADDVARQLQQPGEQVYAQMIALLGKAVVMPDQNLDRSEIARIVFANPDLRVKLNAIVHPAVRQKIINEIEEQKEKYSHIAIEAALLLEENYRTICDEIWCVDARPAIRIQRLIESRGYSRQKAEQIMQSQMAREDFQRLSDRVIDNSGDFTQLKSQLDALFN